MNFENVPIVTKVLINLEPEIKMYRNFVCMELSVKPNFVKILAKSVCLF